MNVNAKIHNDHCKVNTNTIKINYICKVDQELSNYCGTPIENNTISKLTLINKHKTSTYITVFR